MEDVALLRILDSMKALQGAIVEIREKMGSSSSYWTSEKTDELEAAFTKAQGEFLIVEKDKKGNYGMYSSPEAILRAINPAFKKHGLAVRQPIIKEYGTYWLYTKISHQSGQFEASKVELIINTPQGGGKDPHQVIGSASSYMRRYCLSAALGIGGSDEQDPDSVPEVKQNVQTLKQFNAKPIEPIRQQSFAPTSNKDIGF